MLNKYLQKKLIKKHGSRGQLSIMHPSGAGGNFFVWLCLQWPIEHVKDNSNKDVMDQKGVVYVTENNEYMAYSTSQDYVESMHLKSFFTTDFENFYFSKATYQFILDNLDNTIFIDTSKCEKFIHKLSRIKNDNKQPNPNEIICFYEQARHYNHLYKLMKKKKDKNILLLDYESFVMKQTMNSIYKFVNFVNPFLPNPLSINNVKNQLKEYHLTNLKILDSI